MNRQEKLPCQTYVEACADLAFWPVDAVWFPKCKHPWGKWKEWKCRQVQRPEEVLFVRLESRVELDGAFKSRTRVATHLDVRLPAARRYDNASGCKFTKGCSTLRTSNRVSENWQED